MKIMGTVHLSLILFKQQWDTDTHRYVYFLQKSVKYF